MPPPRPASRPRAQDPVPRVPSGTGFRNCGLRVLINGRGDLIVRPSYFERRTMSRSGGSPTHHRMPRYALSLAAVIKAQSAPAKALPGGEAGAAALAAALDLGAALKLNGLDPASLRDPSVQPAAAGGPAGAVSTRKASVERPRLRALQAQLVAPHLRPSLCR